jgi:hypothetical protein
VTVNFTPDAYCFEGTFTIDTQVPVRYSFDAGHTTAGQVVINGNVTFVYNADGSVTITVTGQDPAQYDSVDEFEGVCEMMDKEPADSTVTTVTPGDDTTATGSTLLATLSWTGGETSDMDMHLVHYAETAPDASSSTDWHVYYGNMTDAATPSSTSTTSRATAPSTSPWTPSRWATTACSSTRTPWTATRARR